jgi:hypothetical protein
MSNTLRWITYDKSWRPGNPLFDELFPRIKSEKQQRKDRPSRNGLKKWRFTPRVKNTAHNLRKKVLELSFKEHLEIERVTG